MGDGMSASTKDKLAALRYEYLSAAARVFDGCLDHWTESPIERLVLAQMLVGAGDVYFDQPQRGLWDEAYHWLQRVGVKRHGRILTMAEGVGYVAFQCPFDLADRNIRIDIVLLAGADKYAVELDGHDFHERTKEQAARDKSRDRDLTLLGWRVLRFTGSDVWRDPAAVVAQMVSAMQSSWEADAAASAQARAGR